MCVRTVTFATNRRLAISDAQVAGAQGPLWMRVAPGAAEDPVVQPLAALAEARAGSVVRTGDVAVQRHRDPCELVRPCVFPPVPGRGLA
jgi:hypothetical protein